MDVMDTWATSSLTPQIAGGWEDPSAGDRFEHIFPMDLRPQAHDIIRTWLFSTVVRSYLEEGVLPWSNVAISGWILDPDRKKMSKSVGNVITPRGLLEKHGSDGVRYWASSGRPGTDTAFVESQMEVGRKLALKILNASKFVLSPKLWLGEDGGAGDFSAVEAVSLASAAADGPHLAVEPVDAALMDSLGTLVGAATAAFEAYDYAACAGTDRSVVLGLLRQLPRAGKGARLRRNGAERARSARTGLAVSLSALLRLFAPFMPYVTEEVWSWWHEGSIHRANWPGAPSGVSSPSEVTVYTSAVGLLAAVRRVKSEAKVSPRTEVERVTFSGAVRRFPRSGWSTRTSAPLKTSHSWCW